VNEIREVLVESELFVEAAAVCGSWLDFWVLALHGLVENLDIGEDGFPVRSIESHHVVDVQKRVNAELLIRNLEGHFEVLSSGFWREFIDGDFSRAEMVDECSKGHAIRPGSREVLNVDVTISGGFILNPEEERLFDEVGFRGEVLVLAFVLLPGAASCFPLKLDHSCPDSGFLHPGLLVDGLDGLHHLLQNVQPVARVHIDAVQNARHFRRSVVVGDV